MLGRVECKISQIKWSNKYGYPQAKNNKGINISKPSDQNQVKMSSINANSHAKVIQKS